MENAKESLETEQIEKALAASLAPLLDDVEAVNTSQFQTLKEISDLVAQIEEQSRSVTERLSKLEHAGQGEEEKVVAPNGEIDNNTKNIEESKNVDEGAAAIPNNDSKGSKVQG